MSHTHSQFTKNQPKDGEIVLVCAHALNDRMPGTWHWFNFGNTPEEVKRINQRTGETETFESRWIAVCEECFKRFKDPQDAVRNHVFWRGDEPAIKKVVA